MKFNKKVSDLARKLDYIGVNSERKRKINKIMYKPHTLFSRRVLY